MARLQYGRCQHPRGPWRGPPRIPLNTGFGFADYLLYIDGKAAGVIETEKEGATLTGIEVQSARYAQGLPPIAEQDRIVAEVDRRLSLVRSVEAEVTAKLKRAQSLRQATLAKQSSPSIITN